MRKYILFAFLASLPYGLSAQSVSSGQSEIKDSFKDSRDGKIYKTVKIGNQIWMAENLNFDAGAGSYCYNNSTTNCSKHGKLYTWEVARKAAPAGWHLPTKEECEQLLGYFGGDAKTAYQKLIEGGGSGFNALFGGLRYNDGRYTDLGSEANLWSSTDKKDNAWSLVVGSKGHEAYLKKYSDKANACSVRCVKD